MFILRHKKTLIALFVLILVTTFVILFYQRGQISTSQTPIESLTLGKSKRTDVINKLGNPIDEKTFGQNQMTSFKSDSPNRNNIIVFDKNDTAQVSKEIVTSKDIRTPKSITSKYGNPPETLYGPESQNGINLYVYPKEGIAMLANLESNVLFEIWHFEPIPVENFIQKWAPEYSKKPLEFKNPF